MSAVQPATKIPSCPTAETGLTADTTATPHETRIVVPVALAAVGFTIAYFLSDLIEVVQGDFSTLRLLLTYLGEAAIPLFVMGLYAVQRPRIGRLGLVGAAAFAYSYVFFTGTVIYALIARTPNYRALSSVLAGWMTLHGLIMVAGGVCFGLAVVRAGVLPRWSGACLMVGVLLVAAASPLPNIARTAAAAFPDTAFIGMGLALLVQHRGTGSQNRRRRGPQVKRGCSSDSSRRDRGAHGGARVFVPQGVRGCATIHVCRDPPGEGAGRRSLAHTLII